MRDGGIRWEPQKGGTDKYLFGMLFADVHRGGKPERLSAELLRPQLGNARLGAAKRVEDLTDGRPYCLDAIYPIGHNETFYDLIDASSKRERWGRDR